MRTDREIIDATDPCILCGRTRRFHERHDIQHHDIEYELLGKTAWMALRRSDEARHDFAVALFGWLLPLMTAIEGWLAERAPRLHAWLTR